MGRTTLALSVGLLLASLAPRGAAADCAPVPLPREIRESDLIFVGTVTSVRDDTVTFRVTELFKGDTGRYVTAPMNPMRFYVDASAVGERYIVFMRMRRPTGFVVNDCGSSGRGARVDQIRRQVIQAGFPSRPPRRPPPPG